MYDGTIGYQLKTGSERTNEHVSLLCVFTCVYVKLAFT